MSLAAKKYTRVLALNNRMWMVDVTFSQQYCASLVAGVSTYWTRNYGIRSSFKCKLNVKGELVEG